MDRTIRTAVVTGPTGAIGGALCRLLLAEGVTVYAVARPGSPRAGQLPAAPNLRRVDCDGNALENALPGQVLAADAFFHLAWAGTIGPGRDDMPAQIQNIRASVGAARAASALGCKVFVGAGSQAEYGPAGCPLTADTPCFPTGGYGMAKLCAGQMVRRECARLGLDVVWSRVLSVYGPQDGPQTLISTAADALLAGREPALTAGEQQWDYLYADDAARAFWLLACRGGSGRVYPVGSGTARPLRDYLCELRDAIDPALPLGFGKIPYGPGQVMFLQADIGDLVRDIGFLPRIPFAQGIRTTIQWKKGQKKNARYKKNNFGDDSHLQRGGQRPPHLRGCAGRDFAQLPRLCV